jgi:hypothetical protein
MTSGNAQSDPNPASIRAMNSDQNPVASTVRPVPKVQISAIAMSSRERLPRSTARPSGIEKIAIGIEVASPCTRLIWISLSTRSALASSCTGLNTVREAHAAAMASVRSAMATPGVERGASFARASAAAASRSSIGIERRYDAARPARRRSARAAARSPQRRAGCDRYRSLDTSHRRDSWSTARDQRSANDT